jgi:hypothetical protein
MTDAEWAVLAPVVTHWTGRPTDNRRLWDAIFWVACSKGPWRELPEALGRADTAHRALRRAARSGTLGRLLLLVSDHPAGRALSLRWRVARAARRVARLLDMRHLLLALRLGLRDALPAAPADLPKPHLAAGFTARLGALLPVAQRVPRLFGALRAELRHIAGRRRAWRLTA